MPNWCANSVVLKHKDPTFIARARAAAEKDGLLNEFIPVPKDLKETIAGSFGDTEEQKQLEIQEAYNIKNYGYSNWYDFCVNEWGTKWDVESYEGENTQVEQGVLQFGFDSAWSPPIGIYEELIQQGYDVRAYYYEPGMGYVGKWDNGIDDCIEYSNETSATVRDVIGDELDDMYGISESMAEYEDDAEEVTEWYEQGCESRGLTPGAGKE